MRGYKLRKKNVNKEMSANCWGQGVLAFSDGGDWVSGEVNFEIREGIQIRIRRLRVLILFAGTTSSAQSRIRDRR